MSAGAEDAVAEAQSAGRVGFGNGGDGLGRGLVVLVGWEGMAKTGLRRFCGGWGIGCRCGGNGGDVSAWVVGVWVGLSGR